MNVAVGDEASGVARLYRTEPERCVGRLRWQYIGDVRALNVLVMQSRGIEHGVLAGCIWSIDVHRQARAIAHGDADVSLLYHRFVSACWAAVSADVFAIASAVSSDRPCAARLDYTTVLYDRKVYYGGRMGECVDHGH